MRIFAVLILVFTLLIGSASAQAKLPKVSIINVAQGTNKTDCLALLFVNLNGAATYQMRVTKAGNGSVKYRAGTPKAKQLRGWQDIAQFWQQNTTHTKQVWWCNLMVDQTVRVRVRAVDAKGKAGKVSKTGAFYLKTGFPVWSNYWSSNG